MGSGTRPVRTQLFKKKNKQIFCSVLNFFSGYQSNLPQSLEITAVINIVVFLHCMPVYDILLYPYCLL